MGYYQDLDEARGWDEEVAEHEREREFNERHKRNEERKRIQSIVKKELAKHGVSTSKKPVRGRTVKVKCQGCHSEFDARIVDRRRGWGRYCSKSCKAKKQKNNLGYGSYE